MIGVCVDFKPHLFAIVSLILLQKGFKFYLGVVLISLVPFVAFGSNAQIYLDWIDAIKARGGAGLDGLDLTGVYSFFLQTKLPILLFSLLVFFILLSVYLFSQRSTLVTKINGCT